MLESMEVQLEDKIQLKNCEEVLDVYKTHDLSIFKKIRGNRPRNPQHVTRIKNSILKHGMLFRPILVNENYDVLDGQHRLEGAKETGTFIYYIILEGRGLGSVHVLNLNQNNWSQQDFLESYADMGMMDYKVLQNFAERHPEFTLGDCMSLCTNTYIAQKHNMDVNVSKRFFKEGTWKLLDLEQAEIDAAKLKEIEPYYKNYNRSTFVSTMIDCFYNEEFEFPLFIQKLKVQPTSLVDCATKDQYLDLVEEIYNYKNRNKINLRITK